jgi:hypothetical protein
LRVDYDFALGGYFTVRVPIKENLPENYEAVFELAGSESTNTVEVKLIDALGNVWWVERRGLSILQTTQKLVNKRRHFKYAWGPSREELKRVEFMEVTVKAGSLRHGHIYISGISFAELPPVARSSSPPVVSASTGAKEACLVLDGRGWHSSTREKGQFLTLNFGGLRELSGLIIDWGGVDFAVDYDVQFRAGSRGWRTIDCVRGATSVHAGDTLCGAAGRRQYHFLPESQTSQVRIKMLKSSRGRGYRIARVEVKPVEFAASANEFLLNIAPDFSRGHLPRYMGKRACYWTVVGVSGAENEGLLGEDGVFELGRQMPSIEPFIYSFGRSKLLGWADALEHTHALLEGDLPLPMVTRQHADLALVVQAFATGPAKTSTAYVRYTVRNDSKQRQDGKLFLAIRSFQVNPPWQFLNKPGGFAPIYSIGRTEDGVVVNGKRALVPLTLEHAFFTSRLSSGDIVEHMHLGRPGQMRAVRHEEEDSHGLASGCLEYYFNLGPGESRTFDIAVPFHPNSSVGRAQEAKDEALAFWKKKFSRIDLRIEGCQELVNTIKSQLAYILINRQGQAIQPGKRSYMRTWIRDASMTCAALLMFGFEQEVKDFIKWFAPYVFDNGKVPCCVDEKGADPTPEHDSHGEFIYLVAEYYRFTKDARLVKDLFPIIARVVGHIDALRQTTRTAEFRRSDKKHLMGLLPPSISHEGYSDSPAFSYFDDNFGDVGLKDAAYLAREIGQLEQAALFEGIAREFHQDFVASIYRVVLDCDIEYMPGAADRGDFDPTSTTVALDPGSLAAEFRALLGKTFARYCQFFKKRAQGEIDWVDFTPYEWRIVGSLIRLGEIEKAHELIDFLMSCRRPPEWNHWAEVVLREPRLAKFLGDMPHGWVGSDFLRSIRSCFVYESGNALVVGAGFTTKWLQAGVAAGRLSTHFGDLSVFARQEGDQTVFSLIGKMSEPVFVKVPASARRAIVNRRPVAIDPVSNTVLVDSVPASVVFFEE